MFRRFSVNFALFSIGLDALLVCAALLAAVHLRPHLGFLFFAAYYPRLVSPPWGVYLIFAIEWVSILLLFSVYDGRKNLRAVDEFFSLTLAIALSAVASAGTLYLSYREISRLLFITFVLFAYIGLLSWRALARSWVSSHSRYPFGQRRHVLIIGAGPVGRELQCQIEANAHFGLRMVGFLDDNINKRFAYPDILGPIAQVQNHILQQHVEDVVIALPQRAYKRMINLVSELHHLPVKVWIIPDYFRLALHKAAVEEFAGIPMLDLRAPALNDYQRLIKRAFDILVTLSSLAVVLPLMGLIALLIRLESAGTALLRQARVGENGKIFTMYKFRTMIQNAEELQHLVDKIDDEGHLQHKNAHDPRVTRLGRLLRRASLDELPQLFNVLKGEMSLVGPRPELPRLVEKYEPWQRQRFAIPQGMTGWWQVNGRSDKPMHLHTEDDLYYVQHYSLFLDIYILFKTIAVVLSGRGAF